MKEIFLISLIFFTSVLNAVVDSAYDLKKHYVEECNFVNKNDDLKKQKQCFKLAKKIFEISGSKIYLCFLADYYLEGIGVKKDIAKGLKFYEEVAASESEATTEAQYTLGIYYVAEDSGVRNLNKAEYWLKKASLNGDSNAQCEYAILLENQGKKEESLYWYKNAAKKDNLRAKYWLANFVRRGSDVGISREEAYEMLRSIAEQNFAPAFKELVIMYWQDGNEEKAKYWYCKLINTDFFKNTQKGMGLHKAINKEILDNIKKQYEIEDSNLDEKTK
jgi:TPR repeat protein